MYSQKAGVDWMCAGVGQVHQAPLGGMPCQQAVACTRGLCGAGRLREEDLWQVTVLRFTICWHGCRLVDIWPASFGPLALAAPAHGGCSRVVVNMFKRN